MSKVARLYEQFQPEHYQLFLRFDLAKPDFTGSVAIKGKLLQPANKLTLHADQLKIISAKVSAAGQAIDATKINLDKLTQTAAFRFPKTLPPGRLTITIDYSGKLHEDLHGIYKAGFKFNKRPQTMLATQFEANHARRALPCVDEPPAKATFDVSIEAPKELTVLANTTVKSRRLAKNSQIVSFDTTPKMSSYLLAFIIGKLKYKRARTKHGVETRVYTTPQNVPHANFALQTAIKTLDFFDDYFKTPYPLPKLDLVAVPDFSSGAMENWGLITFREEVLLVDKNNTSLTTKQFVALVIAHELAHQWFGNLVTMKWWNDLWLNEGFASWIEYLALNKLFPQWKMWNHFVVSDMFSALHQDALAHTHPIEVAIDDPAQISEVFDNISYSKGASVIRMLHDYLGETAFQTGLAHYLKRHKYGNAVTGDLWQALAEKSAKPVAKFMSKWTANTGYPVVSYQRRAGNYRLSQDRFYVSPKLRRKVATVWPIPLATSTGDQLLFDRQHMRWQTKSADLPVKFNRQMSGFYRMNYPAEDIQQLLSSLHQFDSLDKLNLFSDAFNLARAGLGKTVSWLELLPAMVTEKSNFVWDEAALEIAIFTQVLNDREQLESGLSSLVRTITQKQIDRLGWKFQPGENHFDQLLRPTLLGLASRFHDSDIIRVLLKLYDLRGRKPIHPDIRSVVYVTAARERNDTKTYQQLLTSYQRIEIAEEKRRLANALCQFKNPALFKKSLALITSNDVKLQEAMGWMASTLSNRHNKHLAWQWLKDNWQWYVKHFAHVPFGSRIINIAGGSFSDEKTVRDIEKFLTAHISPGIKRPVQQAIEIAYTNLAWKQRDYPACSDFLKQLKP